MDIEIDANSDYDNLEQQEEIELKQERKNSLDQMSNLDDEN